MELVNKNYLSFLDKVSYETSRLEEVGLMIAYSIIGFLLPFVLSHTSQQLIVGSIVNMMIILSAFHLKKLQALPLMILPTFGVVAAAQLFGTFTWKITYMMPFIWVGNFLLFAGVKKLYVEKKMNYAFSLPISVLVKSALLFAVAFVFVTMGILPALFLKAMGIVQIITALIGGVVAYGIFMARKAFL